MQDKLYAQDRWAVLLVFQAMDAAGKDGTIKHVMSGVNPQGCEVASFKAPSRSSTTTSCGAACRGCRTAGTSASSTARTTRRCWWCACTPSSSPARSCLPGLVTKRIWEERYEDINDFERYAGRHGDPQVLPQRLEEGAEEALPGAAGRAGEELEVLRRRRPRARALERVHGGLRGHDPRHGHRTPPGTSSRPTTSGSPGSWSRRRSSRRWRA